MEFQEYDLKNPGGLKTVFTHEDNMIHLNLGGDKSLRIELNKDGSVELMGEGKISIQPRSSNVILLKVER